MRKTREKERAIVVGLRSSELNPLPLQVQLQDSLLTEKWTAAAVEGRISQLNYYYLDIGTRAEARGAKLYESEKNARDLPTFHCHRSDVEADEAAL
ncbi:hypothetical protein GW17_00026030 [Ensete ventricosum]|nr:hypothetical protein GW17_00026030 [Ensete ventricosum]RZR90179.1 hypothetical protein BHM03_00018030 [Ensete ventricosum]